MTRRNELLKALEATPRDLARSLRGIIPPTQGIRLAPDQWSLSDILSHLIAVEVRSLARLQRVTQEGNPTIPVILPDPADHNLSKPLEILLEEFNIVRTQTLKFLHPLSSGNWARAAIFEDGQKTTFRYLVQALVDHDTEHLNQLIETKTKLSHL